MDNFIPGEFPRIDNDDIYIFLLSHGAENSFTPPTPSGIPARDYAHDPRYSIDLIDYLARRGWNMSINSRADGSMRVVLTQRAGAVYVSWAVNGTIPEFPAMVAALFCAYMEAHKAEPLCEMRGMLNNDLGPVDLAVIPTLIEDLRIDTYGKEGLPSWVDCLLNCDRSRPGNLLIAINAARDFRNL